MLPKFFSLIWIDFYWKGIGLGLGTISIILAYLLLLRSERRTSILRETDASHSSDCALLVVSLLLVMRQNRISDAISFSHASKLTKRSCVMALAPLYSSPFFPPLWMATATLDPFLLTSSGLPLLPPRVEM
jgi:hypothetical protein